MRRTIRAQDDHFAVQLVRHDGATVREQAANADRPKGVVAQVGAVAVAGFRGETEGGFAGRSAVVRDDPHARAVIDLVGGVGGGRGVVRAGCECGWHGGRVNPAVGLHGIGLPGWRKL